MAKAKAKRNPAGRDIALPTRGKSTRIATRSRAGESTPSLASASRGQSKAQSKDDGGNEPQARTGRKQAPRLASASRGQSEVKGKGNGGKGPQARTGGKQAPSSPSASRSQSEVKSKGDGGNGPQTRSARKQASSLSSVSRGQSEAQSKGDGENETQSPQTKKHKVDGTPKGQVTVRKRRKRVLSPEEIFSDDSDSEDEKLARKGKKGETIDMLDGSDSSSSESDADDIPPRQNSGRGKCPTRAPSTVVEEAISDDSTDSDSDDDDIIPRRKSSKGVLRETKHKNGTKSPVGSSNSQVDYSPAASESDAGDITPRRYSSEGVNRERNRTNDTKSPACSRSKQDGASSSVEGTRASNTVGAIENHNDNVLVVDKENGGKRTDKKKPDDKSVAAEKENNGNGMKTSRKKQQVSSEATSLVGNKDKKSGSKKQRMSLEDKIREKAADTDTDEDETKKIGSLKVTKEDLNRSSVVILRMKKVKLLTEILETMEEYRPYSGGRMAWTRVLDKLKTLPEGSKYKRPPRAYEFKDKMNITIDAWPPLFEKKGFTEERVKQEMASGNRGTNRHFIRFANLIYLMRREREHHHHIEDDEEDQSPSPAEKLTGGTGDETLNESFASRPCSDSSGRHSDEGTRGLRLSQGTHEESIRGSQGHTSFLSVSSDTQFGPSVILPRNAGGSCLSTRRSESKLIDLLQVSGHVKNATPGTKATVKEYIKAELIHRRANASMAEANAREAQAIRDDEDLDRIIRLEQRLKSAGIGSQGKEAIKVPQRSA